MLKIRLMRIGAKKRPFYRVVVVDERNKRNGAYIDLIGTYNPLTQPHEIKLDQNKIDEWVKKGAQLSDGFLRIIGKAPQKPPRKPKKEKQETPAAAPAQEEPKGQKAENQEESAPAEEIPAEDSGANAPQNDEEVVTEATETVETPEEVVETPEEVVETPEESVETSEQAVETPTEAEKDTNNQ